VISKKYNVGIVTFVVGCSTYHYVNLSVLPVHTLSWKPKLIWISYLFRGRSNLSTNSAYTWAVES